MPSDSKGQHGPWTARANWIAAALVVAGLVTSIWMYGTGSSAAIAPFLVSLLTAFLLIGISEYKSDDTPDGFFLYERKMPTRFFGWTYVASNVGLFSSIFYSIYIAHYFGPAGMLWPTLAWFTGMFWFSRSLPKLMPFLQKGQSIHEFIGHTFGRTERERLLIRRATSLVTITLLWASIAIEVKFSADLVSAMFGLSSAVTVASVVAVLATIYAYLSGYRGATRTDLAQGIMMAVGAVALAIASIYFLRDRPFVFDENYTSKRGLLLGPSWSSLAGMVALLLPYQFCVMDMWQRCIAISQANASDSPEVRIEKMRAQSFSQPAIIFLLLFICWFIVGVVTKGTGFAVDPSDVLGPLLAYLGQNGLLGFIVLIFALGAFGAAVMSTFDTFLVALVQAFMYDWYGQTRPHLRAVIQGNSTDFDRRRFVNAARFWVGVFGLSAIVLAGVDFPLLAFWVGMYSLMLGFFPAVYLGISYPEYCARRISAKSAAISIFVGFLCALLCGVLGTVYGKSIAGVSFSDIGPVATLVVSAGTIGVRAYLERTPLIPS